jgi:antitoxin component HigA of HigAB toxin-antitoxin module
MQWRRLPPIQTEEEYRTLLAETEALCELDPRPHSAKGRRLLGLAIAVEQWELDHYPICDVKND